VGDEAVHLAVEPRRPGAEKVVPGRALLVRVRAAHLQPHLEAPEPAERLPHRHEDRTPHALDQRQHARTFGPFHLVRVQEQFGQYRQIVGGVVGEDVRCQSTFCFPPSEISICVCERRH
jgi:hypothetical protein